MAKEEPFRRLLESDLKVGDMVKIRDEDGLIINRTVRTLTVKFQYSTVKYTFNKNIPAIDLGLVRPPVNSTNGKSKNNF